MPAPTSPSSSSDKDLMQLTGAACDIEHDEEQDDRARRSHTKFGVPPERVIDVQALAGDSVDNVPGVPGIGVKTAAELIEDYGDLEALLARAGEIKQPKRREKLIEFAEQARISRRLVELKLDVPVEVPMDRSGFKRRRPSRCSGSCQAMKINTLTKRIAEALGVEAPAPLAQSVGGSLKGRTDAAVAGPNRLAEAGTAERNTGPGTPHNVVAISRSVRAPYEAARRT